MVIERGALLQANATMMVGVLLFFIAAEALDFAVREFINLLLFAMVPFGFSSAMAVLGDENALHWARRLAFVGFVAFMTVLILVALASFSL